MARAKTFDYFESYLELAHRCKETAIYIQNMLASDPMVFNETIMHEIHAIEHAADGVNHEIQKHLYSDFIVPLERDNMSLLANDLDDVEDTLEEIAIRMHIYHVKKSDKTMQSMAQLLTESVMALEKALQLLKESTKKTTAINNALIAIQDAEDKGDQLYIKALYDLYDQSEVTGEERMILHRIYDTFENALDSLEHTAEDIQSIITQNV